MAITQEKNEGVAAAPAAVVVVGAQAPSGAEAPTTRALAVAAHAPSMCVNGLVFDAKDIDIPKINIIQKMSSIEGPVGAAMLDQKYELVGPESPVEVVVAKATKGWREDIPYDNDEMPRIAHTEEERIALEAESSYKLLEYADIVLLFKQPADVDDEAIYPFPLGTDHYAVGRINVAKDAYKNTYKRLTTFQMFNPSTAYNTRCWEFKSMLMQKGKYTWYAPSLTVTSKTPSDEVLNFLATFG